MSNGAKFQQEMSWLESCSFVHLFRAFRLAIHPSKIILALGALLVTWVWGFALDEIWLATDKGVRGDAIMTYAGSGAAPAGHESAEADQGVFATWCRHEAWCIESGLMSITRGNFWAGGPEAAVGLLAAQARGNANLQASGPLPIGLKNSVVLMVKGTTWMVAEHCWFALLFLLIALGIWAMFGGAICRIAAVEFARDEKISMREALAFAKQRYLGGFFLAPLFPVLIVLALAATLAVGGVFLSIPYLGDILGSLLFVLAILVGGVTAVFVLASAVGGSLFWPTIAAEGSQCLDAVSRSIHYVGTKPWRTLFYALVMAAYGSLCFVFVKVVAYLTLAVTHACVGFGTAPFGWWGVRDGGQNKLDALWLMPSINRFAASPADATGIEAFSGWIITSWVFVVGLLVWAFLAAFYFCGSTVIYFLLRRENDAMDLEDVFLEAYEETEHTPAAGSPEAPAATTEAPAADGTVQVTVEGQAVATAPAEESAAPDSGGDGDGDSESADEAGQTN